MALKADRVIVQDDISYIGNSVAERGLTLCGSVSGSGIAQGDSGPTAALQSNPSGKVVAGMLLGDIVNVDLTRYHLNFHKDETQIGNRVRLLRRGTVTTDKYTGSPVDGDTAYLTSNGVLTPTLSSTGGLVATPKVGKFRGIPDESGFVKVDVALPVV